MHRPTKTYYVGALLALFTLYALFSASQPSTFKVLKSETSPHRDSTGKQDHLSPLTKEHEKPQYPVDNHDGPPPASSSTDGPHDSPSDHKPTPTHASHPQHTIDTLLQTAERQFEETLSHRTHTLNDAAVAYRKRRGRHPPPGFDRWYKYASDNDAIMVEDYFDQIYHDLNPFWAIQPNMLRAQARAVEMAVEIKDGRAKANTDWFWHEIWARMINETSDYLPDMYIAINEMDESRLLVNWEIINDNMKVAEAEKKMTPAKEVISKFQGWGAEKEDNAPDPPAVDWNGFNVYRFARSACPPDSPARQVGGVLLPEKILGDHRKDATRKAVSSYFDGRLVSNYTEATDYCSDASIGGLHGALMHPLSCRVSDVLMPLFGGSKFQTNNEILLPAPMYWNEEVRFGGAGNDDQVAWDDKTPTVMWRGTATGGRSKPYTWNLFHRHRFVALTNGTKYELASPTSDPIFSPFFRESAIQHLDKATQTHLAGWLRSTHDVAFTNLVCDEIEEDGACWYLNDEFAMTKPIEFVEQFTHKYFPDIDGNSFSGRYRAFLLSNSVPIKATIYREWHDARLVAWKHFVPMNNRFSDYYSIMEYFLGSEPAGLPGHDEQAQKIAADGRSWAEKVLRKVDMQIYVGRLLLEYARLTDDKRAVLGWVDDLLSNPGA